MHKRKVVQYLKKYVKDLKKDQISSRLLDGEFELRDVELEVDPLNELLVGVLPYTLELRSVFCDLVHVRAPLKSLRKKPVKVEVGACRASVEVRKRDDVELLQEAARRQRDALGEAFVKREREGGLIPPDKLSDLKVVITDSLEISIASVEVVLVSASPAHLPAGQLNCKAVPVLEVKIQGVAVGPLRDERGSARKRSPTCSTMCRKVSVESVQVRVNSKLPNSAPPAAVQGSPAKVALEELQNAVAIERITLELLDWRDIGTSSNLGMPSQGGPRLCGFAREIRAGLQIPHVDIRGSPKDIAAITMLVKDAAAPPLVPIEALPIEARYLHWSHPAAVAVLEAIRARQAAGQSAKSPTKKSSKSKNRLAMPSLRVPTVFAPPRRATGEEPEEQPDMTANLSDVADKALKTATSAASMVQQGSKAAASGALKTADAANVMAQRASKAAASGAVAGANAAASGAVAGASAAVAGASAAASAAKMGATAAAERAAAGARMAEKMIPGQAASAASRAAAAARQAASGKALGAASSLFKTSKIGKLTPWNKSSPVKNQAIDTDVIVQDLSEEELKAQAHQAMNAILFEQEGNTEDLKDTDAKEQELINQAITASLADAQPSETPEGGQAVADPVDEEVISTTEHIDKAPVTLPNEDQQDQTDELSGQEANMDNVAELDDPALRGDEGSISSSSEGSAGDDTSLLGDDNISLLGDDDTISLRGDDADEVWDDISVNVERRPSGAASLRSGVNASSGPPALSRRSMVHAAIGSVRVEVQVDAEAFPQDLDAKAATASRDALVLDVQGVDFSGEVLGRLSEFEQRSLERMGFTTQVGPEAAASRIPGEGLQGPSAALGGNLCLTVGAARLRLLRDICGSASEAVVFYTETATSAPPWLLTLRGSAVNGAPANLHACVHGARAASVPDAFKAVKSLVQVMQAAFEAAPVGAVGELPAVQLPDINVTCRNCIVDLAPERPLKPLSMLVPGVFLASHHVKLPALRGFGAPSVPPWHASVPAPADSSAGEPDFTVYSYICDADSGDTHGVVACGGDTGSGGGFWLTERQWRVARASVPVEVLVPAAEFVALSQAKLRAVEHAAECEMLAEHWEAGAAQRLTRETARRIPHVRELLDDDGEGHMTAQLAALEAEVSFLEDGNCADSAKLREHERAMGMIVTSSLSEHLAREADLCRQFDEEQNITKTLESVVEQQAAFLEELQRLQRESAEKQRANRKPV